MDRDEKDTDTTVVGEASGGAASTDPDSFLEAVLESVRPPGNEPSSANLLQEQQTDAGLVNVENLLFGYSLGKHHRANIEVGSFTATFHSYVVLLLKGYCQCNFRG